MLESYCLGSACHGVAPDAEERGEVIDWSFFFVRVRDDGLVEDVDQAYDRAKSRINTRERPELSTLLRKPLAPWAGGLHHLGGVQFTSPESPAYRAIRDWIAAESDGGEGADPAELSPLERRFADDVLPLLASRQCLNEACHGAFSPFTAFEPPVVLDGEPVFSVKAIRKNREAARHHLFLGGDPTLSRLVRKVLPLERGGILHRGGNRIFFDGPDDPGVKAIVGWALEERAALLGETDLEVQGIVFVRGSVGPQPPFYAEAFVSGTDLFVLEPPAPGGALRNLTAAAHPEGPADVRDPAVSHDGRRVAFAMRLSTADAFHIYEIGVDGSGLRQLTFGPDHDVQPTYGPDGRIVFVSTRGGTLAAGLDQIDTELWSVDPETGDLERLTFDPSPEATPTFIGTGKSYGTLAFTMRRVLGDRYEAPVMRVPLCHDRRYHADPEIHIHHGVTSGADAIYGMRTLPDGRFVATLLDRTSQWRGGALAVFERQFGPEVPRGMMEDEASVAGFRHAFTVLDADGLYRHPAPLPDGRILVSYDRDPGAAPDLGLYVATLEEDWTSGEPRLVALDTLLDEPGVSEYDAEPIVVRPPEDDPGHGSALDPTRTTGILAYRHVETLEALFSRLPVYGAKTVRSDLRYARLVEWIPITPADAAAAPPGIGSPGVVRILAEVPLQGGSLYLEVPAGRPFRVQFLDEDRMAVGAQHARWIHVAPGEKFPGGVSPSLYPVLCASCHGAFSGDPGDVGGPVPDTITAASITRATHDNLDPRRPRAPTPVGAEPMSVTFEADVRPLLARSCVGCHGGADPAGGLDLEARPTASYDTAYEAIIGRGLVDPGSTSARSSVLLERVLGRELEAPPPVTGACPGDPPLAPHEVLTLIRWIDLGALYRGGAL